MLLDEAGVALEVHANPGHVEDDRLAMTWPVDSPYFSPETGIDKAAVVREALGAGGAVAFAGDGPPDLVPALLVPPRLRFARGYLARMLAERGEPFRPFDRWAEVAQDGRRGRRLTIPRCGDRRPRLSCGPRPRTGRPREETGMSTARRIAPYAGLLAIALGYFAPLVLHPSRTLYGDHSDLIALHVPWMTFLARSWQLDGELPLWNPLQFAGLPFAHDVQAAISYPPHAIFRLVGEGGSARR